MLSGLLYLGYSDPVDESDCEKRNNRKRYHTLSEPLLLVDCENADRQANHVSDEDQDEQNPAPQWDRIGKGSPSVGRRTADEYKERDE
ncbi:hypothetical protein [Prosthecobacter sp.]|uniref:hypothetical protein n=1 Tax=Prosthecobacter sp. TaxID=1965333 RepID=UPI003784CFB7